MQKQQAQKKQSPHPQVIAFLKAKRATNNIPKRDPAATQRVYKK